MKSFWKYQVRFQVGRWLVHLGIRLMPAGLARSELTSALWAWNLKVTSIVNAERERQERSKLEYRQMVDCIHGGIE